MTRNVLTLGQWNSGHTFIRSTNQKPWSPANEYNFAGRFKNVAGKEVRVVETVRNTTHGQIVDVHLASRQPVIRELKNAARATGVRLRLLLPGTSSSQDYRGDRVTVVVSKYTDGKYRIAHTCRLG